MHPDAALVAAFLSGDTEGRTRLIERWLPPVLDWCTRLGGPRVDPEDAAHDVFLVVLTRLDSLERPERLGAWIFSIVRKVLDRHRRRAWWRRWLPGVEVDAVSNERPADLRLGDARMARELRVLLDRLPTEQREAIVLADVEDRPIAEVAELVGVPIGTVKSRLRLGRQRLRAEPSLRALFENGSMKLDDSEPVAG